MLAPATLYPYRPDQAAGAPISPAGLWRREHATPTQADSAARGAGPAGTTPAVADSSLAQGTNRPPIARISYTPGSDEAPAGNPAAPASRDSPLVQNVLRNALDAYAGGDLGAGDALASEITDPLARTGLEWAALHAPSDIGFNRFAAFLANHPKWPAREWVARRAEDELWRDKSSPTLIAEFFAHRTPETALGALALARARVAQGRPQDAAALVRGVWRDDDLFPSLETAIRKEFGDVLTADDDKRRADRLLYKGQTAAGLRAAAHAGVAELALARVRIAAMEGRASPAVMTSVPETMRQDPSYVFAEIQRLQHANKTAEAAKLMLGAPRDAAAIIDPDAWWAERRWIARKLLDLGDAKTAYLICAGYAPGSGETNIDAEFHAGWIALRFLSDAKTAETHFAKLASIAKAPVSRARAYYWLARTDQAMRSPEASDNFRAAAAFPTTYYGQLAQSELGGASAPIRIPARVAQGAERDEAIRVVELLGALGHADEALSLSMQTARVLDDESQLAALAAIGKDQKDARETLAVGKIAARRGFALDNAAFPTFGVPNFSPLANSAPPAIVYAIARQESAFQTNARSTAGAQGLMQMILSTARRTAQQFKVPFDAGRLANDPAFNAELGAAHLGQLLSEQRGSLILTFAAYNAGGHRVKEWIDAHGDPRLPSVDPVDWVERIPITETRDYVQRVLENFNVYKARFEDLRRAPTSPPPTASETPSSSLPSPAPLLGPAVDAPIGSPVQARS